MSTEARVHDLIASLSYFFAQTRLFFNLKWAEVRSTSFCISLLSVIESGDVVLATLVCLGFQLATRTIFWLVMGTMWTLFHLVLFDSCVLAIVWRLALYFGAIEEIAEQRLRQAGYILLFIALVLLDLFVDILFWETIVHRDAHQQFLMFFFRMAFDILLLVAIHHSVIPLIEAYKALSLWFNSVYKRLYDKFKRAD